MASNTVYSHAMRVLICAQCGAPFEVPLVDGTAQCTYCSAVNHLSSRDESADLAAAKAGPSMSEAQRFEAVRQVASVAFHEGAAFAQADEHDRCRVEERDAEQDHGRQHGESAGDAGAVVRRAKGQRR